MDLIKNVGGAELGDAYNTILQGMRHEPDRTARFVEKILSLLAA